MAWIRVDTDLEMDRKFRRLSGVGRALLQFVWRLAKRKEGRIDADDWDVHYFSDMIGFSHLQADMEKAMDDMISLGFLERFEGGDDLFVPNWEKFQNPKDRTNAERQKRYRDKLKAESVTKVTDSNAVTNVIVTRNAVRTDSTVHDVQDSTIRTDLLPVAAAAKPVKKKPARKTEAKSNEVWKAYSWAYEQRYKVKPVRNAQTNSQACKLVDKLGPNEAPHVAAYYVTLNNSFYVTKGHAIGILVSDAEKVRTEWATGNNITQTKAREADRAQAVGDVWQRAIEKHGDK